MTRDPRLTPARPDLAAAHLRGEVAAPRYVEGRRMRVAAPCLAMTADAAGQGAMVTELLRGEAVTVYDEDIETGRAWVQCETDGYVGYVRAEGLSGGAPPTHRVRTRSAQLYAAPQLKLPPLATVPFLAGLCVVEERDGYARTDTGLWCPAPCLEPAGTPAPDFVEVAARFMGAPYLWGGRSVFGLDCSALVQLALGAAGVAAPRDSDQQEAALGQPVSDAPQRGDLVFWKGHVGILSAPDRLLHANAHHMAVVEEPFAAAAARIEATSTGAMTSRRRLAQV